MGAPEGPDMPLLLRGTYATMRIVLAAVVHIAAGSLHAQPPLLAGWEQSEQSKLTLDRAASMSFTLHLKENPESIAEMKKFALAVNDPKSEHYGSFVADPHALTTVAPLAVAEVKEWLTAGGMMISSVMGPRIEVTATLSQAEDLFATRFMTLTHHSGLSVVRAGSYILPEAIEARVAAIFGLHGLPLPLAEPLQSTSAPMATVTPNVLSSIYNISGVSPRRSDDNHQAVAEFQGQYMNETDLTSFFTSYIGNYVKGKDDVINKYVGDKNKQVGGMESMLDVEYMMGVSPGIKTEYWLWDNLDFCGGLYNWTAALIADPSAPLVHSISYGNQGPVWTLYETGCDDAKIKAIDENFAKIAAKGITLIFASGDSGAGIQSCGGDVCDDGHCGGAGRCDCKCKVPSTFSKNTILQGKVFKVYERTDDVETCCQKAHTVLLPPFHAGWSFNPGTRHCTVFSSVTGNSTVTDGTFSAVISGEYKLYPIWPGSSPWVTAVGGTAFAGGQIGAETATVNFGSGGGFSDMFSIEEAKWQQEAVEGYLKAPPFQPMVGSYPAGGRATPDISAMAEGYQVVLNGQLKTLLGTSASAPVVAGLFSLINEARLQAGKKPMGFVNPWIYQNPDCFTDITKGDNWYSDMFKGEHTGIGFNCSKGWDPVTGLGTPIFHKMLNAALL